MHEVTMFERIFYGLVGLSSDMIQEDSKGRLSLISTFAEDQHIQSIDNLLELGSTYRFLSHFVNEVKERNPYTVGTGTTYLDNILI